MRQTVRVAAIQAESAWLDLAAGVDKVIALIGEAAAGGAQLVAFPHHCPGRDTAPSALRAHPEFQPPRAGSRAY